MKLIHVTPTYSARWCSLHFQINLICLNFKDKNYNIEINVLYDIIPLPLPNVQQHSVVWKLFNIKQNTRINSTQT